jgi:hypothetical protein
MWRIETWATAWAESLSSFFVGKTMLATLLCVCANFSQTQTDEMPWLQVAKDKKSFTLDPSGKQFTPWGFNYDHDTQGRLIEDYWDQEWDRVEVHFGQHPKGHGVAYRAEIATVPG